MYDKNLSHMSSTLARVISRTLLSVFHYTHCTPTKRLKVCYFTSERFLRNDFTFIRCQVMTSKAIPFMSLNLICIFLRVLLFLAHTRPQHVYTYINIYICINRRLYLNLLRIAIHIFGAKFQFHLQYGEFS